MGGKARQRKLRREQERKAGYAITSYPPGQGRFIVGETAVYWAPNDGRTWQTVPEPLASEVRRKHIAREEERASRAAAAVLPPALSGVASVLERTAPAQERSRP